MINRLCERQENILAAMALAAPCRLSRSSSWPLEVARNVFVTPRDPARKNDIRRAPIHREAYTRARLRKAGLTSTVDLK
jgi:hypothetical protein